VTDDCFKRLLRWYPPRWRARYGEEMAALLEDTYSTHADVPPRVRVALARAGLAERAREAGLARSLRGPEEQLRAGAALVLWGWALVLVAGAMFATFSDNWLAGTPSADRALAGGAYDVVVAAGVAGSVLVLLAASMAAPAFARFVAGGGWPVVRPRVRRAVVATVAAVSLLGGLLAWAHQLTPPARNGGNPLYGAAFVVVGVATAVAVGFATAAAVSVARRVEFTPRTLHTLGVTALAVAPLMLVVLGGTVTWWVSESLHAPGVLRSGIGGGLPFDSVLVPPTLLAAALLMVLGLGLAAWGALRIARPLGRLRHSV